MQTGVFKNSTQTKGQAIPPVQLHAIQPKLEINTPGDKYEQEADAMADRVMRMADTGTAGNGVSSMIGPSVQRKCAACEEEEKEKPVMRKTDSGGYGMQASSSLVSSLNSSKGGGSALPKGTRDFMESAFSADFSGVRVHTDSHSAEMSKSINARAFTHGRDVYFNNGEFAPGSTGGQRLLAHELAHTMQQSGRGNTVGKKNNPAHIQRAPTLKILDKDTAGTPKADERRADASCPIHCNGSNIGTLNAVGLFYHRDNKIDATPTATDDGVGTALHFQTSGPQTSCKCDHFKIIQVIKTTRPSAGRDGGGYVDNNGTHTPFYGDVFFSGTGEHKIPPNYPDAGEKVSTTTSIYDRPERHTAGVNATIMWQAEACVACIGNAKPDIVLGGVTYGFTIPFDKATNKFGAIQGIGPQCLAAASPHFESTLRNDPTTSNYDFKVDDGKASQTEKVQKAPLPDQQFQLGNAGFQSPFVNRGQPSIPVPQLGLHLMGNDKNKIDDFLSRHKFMAGPGMLPMLDSDATTISDIADLVRSTVLSHTLTTDIEAYINSKWLEISGKAITFKPPLGQPITATIPDIFGAIPPGPEDKSKSPDMPNFTAAYNFAGHVNLQGPAKPTTDSTIQFQIAQDTRFKTKLNDDTTATLQKLYQFSYNFNTQQFQSVVGGQGTIEKELIENLLKVSGFAQILAGVAWTKNPVTGTLLVVQPSVGAQVTVTFRGTSDYPVQVAGQVALSTTSTQGQPTTGDANLTVQATVPLEPTPKVKKHEPTTELTGYFEIREWIERNNYSEIERITLDEKERFLNVLFKDGQVIPFDVDAIGKVYDSNLNEQPALKKIIESKIPGVDNPPLKERLTRIISNLNK